MIRRLAILAALAAIPGAASSGDGAVDGVEAIRAPADGAGPSHLFWLTGDRSGDTIGVVDPLFAAIRFYRVARGEGDLAGRMTALGVCALPVDFRPWRVHALKGRVLIESMPDPGALGHVVTPRDLRTRMLAVRHDLLRDPAPFDSAAKRIDGSGWDPASETQCGKPGRPGAIGAGMPGASRASARTIRLGRLAVHSSANRLLSARELEPAKGMRIVQASEALPSGDGVIRVRYRILAFARGRLAHAIALRDTELRGKFGQKPVAVLPSGELLAMGKEPGGTSPFHIRSCGLVTRKPEGLCEEDKAPVLQAAAAKPSLQRQASHPLSARTIFANVERLASYRLSVDTSALPEDCRRAEGCRIGGDERFVPIRGIRLTRGTFTRRGIPYAQARVPEDVDRLLAASPQQLERALERVKHGARGWPGNLRDGLEGDLGIDCSGLVQIAWGGRGGTRLDTRSLQGLGSPLACSSRLPGPEWLRPGDAIGLRVDSPVHLANHVVLFAAALPLDGASDAWLVLESSSGCDGVCWSVYDPSWFNGWGIYRAGGRSDAACVAGASAAATPIPYDLSRWSALTEGR